MTFSRGLMSATGKERRHCLRSPNDYWALRGVKWLLNVLFTFLLLQIRSEPAGPRFKKLLKWNLPVWQTTCTGLAAPWVVDYDLRKGQHANLNSTIWQKAETDVSIGADCSWKWYFRDLDLPSSLCFKGVLKRWFSAQFSLVFFYSCSLLHLPVFCVSSVYQTLFVTADLKNWVMTGFIYVLFCNLKTDDIAVLFGVCLLNRSWIFQEHLLFQLACVLQSEKQVLHNYLQQR